MDKSSEAISDKAAKKPWRKIYDNNDFEKTLEFLKQEIEVHKDTRLNIVMIGQSGSGKSSLINAIFSISRGRIVNKARTKGCDVEGFGTYHFEGFDSASSDIFNKVVIFDTMGYTTSERNKEYGIQDDDLKAVCEGRVECGHEFNKGTVSDTETENRPHCVLFVVSAEALKALKPNDDDSVVKQKMMSLKTVVPHDVAKLAIVTKMDIVCEETNKDIRNIYKSQNVHSLVKKAKQVFDVKENEVFPIVSFEKEVEVDAAKSVPILYAMRFAFNFAFDRKEAQRSRSQEHNPVSAHTYI